MIEISSVQNPKIKSAVKLMNRRERDETKTFLIEGEREVRRALEMNFPLTTLFVCPDFMRADEMSFAEELEKTGVAVFLCTESVFKKISYRESPDGFLAIGVQKNHTLDGLTALLKNKKKPLLLVAESVEKPGNLGTLLRSCDAAGVDALILSDKVADIYNPNVVRASVGTLFSVPIFEGSAQEIITCLKNHHIMIVAATPEGSIPYTECALNSHLAIVMGAEHEGLSPLWKEKANARVAIPMCGLADSLNVTTAATVILYEALRQRAL